MTYAEIKGSIDAHHNRKKEDLQLKAMFSYKLGELIGIAMNDPKKYPANVKAAFEKSGIFDEEKDQYRKQQDWQIMKDRINKYSYLKKKRGETV